MEANFVSFLNSHRVTVKGEETHASMIRPKGSFKIISEKDKNAFRILYCNAVMKNVKLGIAEKPNKHKATPLHVDIDFRFSPNLYTPSDDPIKRSIIKEIIKYYQIAIKDIVSESSFNPKMQTCILLEKEHRYRFEDGVLKSGFHLHFPFFVSKWWVQDKIIRDRVMEYTKQAHIFDNLSFLESIDKVFDTVATKTWLMYGSRKTLAGEAYEITACYDASLDEMTIDEVFDEEIEDINSTRDVRKKTKYDLPTFMSILGKESFEARLSTRYKNMEPKITLTRKRAIKHTKTTEAILEELKLIEESGLVDMLSVDRAEDYNKWMEVGWTLFCIGEGHEKALSMWLEFSQKCPDKYEEDACISRWNEMENRGKTIGSLKMMAQLDNPERYLEWRRVYIQSYYEDCIRYGAPKKEYSAHYPLAKLLHTMYDNFVCANSKKDTWYKFQGHRWQLVDDGVDLKILLAGDVQRSLYAYNSQLNDQASKTADGDQREKINRKITIVTSIINALTKVPFVSKVVEAAKCYFYDRNFLSKLDENRSLLGLENGVYDLDAGIFREGRPDDYITYSTGKYYYEYDIKDPEVQRLFMILDQIFVDTTLREYVHDSICSCLKGGNQNKRFFILTGDGDNGKSLFVQLLEMIFGDYIWKFEQELLVRGRGNSSSTARPELAQIRGKRIAVVDEIPSNKEIDIGMLKKLTGNDSFFARLLFDNGGLIKPMFTLFLQCNALPKIPAHDGPTWNRTRVVDCESNFVDNPPETKEEQIRQKTFKVNKNLAEELEDLAEPYLWFLLNRYRQYRRKGLVEPERVQVSTKHYREDNDVYLQFISECLERDEKSHITVTQMYHEFKTWYAENYPEYNTGKDKIGQRTMRQELSNKKRLGKALRVKTSWLWKGWKFTEEAEKEDESENESKDSMEGMINNVELRVVDGED